VKSSLDGDFEGSFSKTFVDFQRPSSRDPILDLVLQAGAAKARRALLSSNVKAGDMWCEVGG
jgi:hypothetical protein